MVPHLEESKRYDLYHKGYCRIEKVVPDKLIDNALRAINCRLCNIDMSSEGPCYGFMVDVNGSSEILNIFHSTLVKKIVDSVVGKDSYEEIELGQIALNFPVLESPSTLPTWHLDGMYESTIGAQKKPWNFTLLIGVFMSNVPTVDCGNLTMYPGGHLILADYFRRNGTQSIFKNKLDALVSEYEQVIGRSGDIVLCHPLVPHMAVMPNLSPNIRYMLFFRVSLKNREHWSTETMIDPFREWTVFRENDYQSMGAQRDSQKIVVQ